MIIFALLLAISYAQTERRYMSSSSCLIGNWVLGEVGNDCITTCQFSNRVCTITGVINRIEFEFILPQIGTVCNTILDSLGAANPVMQNGFCAWHYDGALEDWCGAVDSTYQRFCCCGNTYHPSHSPTDISQSNTTSTEQAYRSSPPTPMSTSLSELEEYATQANDFVEENLWYMIITAFGIVTAIFTKVKGCCGYLKKCCCDKKEETVTDKDILRQLHE